MTTLTTKTTSTKIKQPWVSEQFRTNFAMLFLVITSVLLGFILGQLYEI